MRRLGRNFRQRQSRQGKTIAQKVAALFSAGEQGAWYDPSDFSTMFQNAAGTIPVTAVGQAVGRILDKSGRGNHATQTTDTKRPVLSAKYNIIKSTTNVGTWVPTNVTATGNQTGYNSSNTGISIYETSTNGRHGLDQVGLGAWQIASSGITYKIRVKSLGSPWCNITFGASGPSNYPDIGCFLNLITGQIGTIQASTVNVPTVNNLGNGWWEVIINSSITGLYSLYASIKCASANNVTSYIGNPNNGILVDSPDLRLNNESISIPSYQRVNTVTDYDTTGFPPYLLFDGIDDALQTASVNFTGTDKVTVWAGVRKLSDAAGSIAELSSTPTAADSVSRFILSAAGGNTPSYGLSITSNSATGGTLSIRALTYIAPITNVVSAVYTSSIASGAGRVIPRINATTPSSIEIAFEQGGLIPTTFGNYPLYIGSRGGTTLPFNGRLYSLIIRGAQSTDAQITNTEAYVNSRTGAY